MSEWVIKFNGLSRTADSEVHIVLFSMRKDYNCVDLLSDKKMEIYSYISFNKSSTTNVNTLRPRENGRHFADNILKCIF